MRIVRDFSGCPPSCQGSVVALGNFDGVHLGHREILGQCVASARAYHVPSAVMTFEPHPREYFSKQHQRLRLCSFRQKLDMTERCGVDILFLVRFNERFATLSAENFVFDVLHRQLAVKHVVTGYNFAFGKGRSGDTDFLSLRGQQLGFGTTACPPVDDGGGHVISSSGIRQLLAAGEVRKASALLGHPYVIEGRVRAGEKRGRTIGFPTANIALTRLFNPRHGVYAVRVTVQGENRAYDGVANIGTKPTFDGTRPLLEVHLFDANPDLYGRLLRVECVDFIRDEVRFDSVDALKAQITLDCQQAKRILSVPVQPEGTHARS